MIQSLLHITLNVRVNRANMPNVDEIKHSNDQNFLEMILYWCH